MSLSRMPLGAMTLKWNHVFRGVEDLQSPTASSRYYDWLISTCNSVTCLISPMLPLSKSDYMRILRPLSRLNSYLFFRDLLSSELLSCFDIWQKHYLYKIIAT